MKIINIVGARPNFMKVAPIHRVMEASNKIDPILLHTGQHYDKDMSKVFFEDLGMPNPNIYLGIGSGSHAVQTARIMVEFEKILLDLRPDLILVVGDVNSTLACALVAVKLNIPVIHVESGLRSFDNTMPEEINRKITDSISEYLFVSEKSGINNLLNENIDKNKIHFVGNVMIDSLVYHLETAKKSKILEENGIDSDFILTTIHRPSNVDCIDNLREVINTLEKLQIDRKVIFPIHPRTKNKIIENGFNDKLNSMKNLHLCKPVGYLDFIKLMSSANVVITDSGGIQEETTFLGVPCITLRNNTERPITIDVGTNILMKLNSSSICNAISEITTNQNKKHVIPELWDGNTSKRIIDILLR